MEELAGGGFIGKFGLDVRLLIAQVVNFLLVLLVLTRFVFRPLLAVMRKRSERIAEGIRGAQELEKQRSMFALREQEERARIREERAHLLASAEGEAHARREELLRKAEADAAAMHDRAALDAEKLREDAVRGARQDVGSLVVSLAERVLNKRLPAGERDAYLEEALRDARRRAEGAR